MDRRALIAAVERAVEVRGTVMLQVRQEPGQWCAAEVAHDGSIELKVGEPRRGWRRWRTSEGERWLGEHGFVHVPDAWALPVPEGASAHQCAELLAHALCSGLGSADDAALEEVLTHRGVVDTPLGAPHVEHIRAALVSLATSGRGKVSFFGGRPSELWAWAYAYEGDLLIEPEPPGPPTDPGPSWRAPLRPDLAAAEAERLVQMLYDEFGRDSREPLFVSFMDS